MSQWRLVRYAGRIAVLGALLLASSGPLQVRGQGAELSPALEDASSRGPTQVPITGLEGAAHPLGGHGGDRGGARRAGRATRAVSRA